MKTLVRGALAASLLAGSALAATPAFAQDESDISVSANVAMVTDYRFRGVSFSDGDFAIQGGVDVGHSSGFYVGTWASSLEDGAYGSTEVDIYGGYSGAITESLSFDVGILYYLYPNGTSAFDTDYWEPYASLTGAVGPAEVTVGAAYAWDQDSLDENLYVYGDVGFGIPNTPVSVSGHLGYTDGSLAIASDGDNFDWSIGASAAVFGPLEVGVSYIGVGGPSIDSFSDDTVVATLSASF